MAKIRCEKGHVFDDNKFSSCPYCGVILSVPVKLANKVFTANTNVVSQTTENSQQIQHTVPLGKQQQTESKAYNADCSKEQNFEVINSIVEQSLQADEIKAVLTTHPVQEVKDLQAPNNNLTVQLKGGFQSESQLNDQEKANCTFPKTVVVGNYSNSTSGQKQEPSLTIKLDRPEQNQDYSVSNTSLPISEQLEEIQTLTIATDEESTQIISLLSEPEIATNSVEANDDVTRGLWADRFKIRPVAGWLVCVDGPDVGHDYRFTEGKNAIGRSGRMDIALTEDSQVVMSDHAYVVFDPRSGIYALLPGEGEIYCNGNQVEEYIELADRDTIKLGNTTLAFIPFYRNGDPWRS